GGTSPSSRPITEVLSAGDHMSSMLRRAEPMRVLVLSGPVTLEGRMNVTFDFGETEASYSFLQRHPKFLPAFERLMAVGNKCYGREPKPRNRAEHVVFGLGHSCRQDFLEVLFMGVNGFSTGALKLIRGLFERTIALAYIVKHPEKAERLVRFGAIQ